MPQYTVESMAPSVQIFRGNPKCPKTVMIQIVTIVGSAGSNSIWICPDKPRLDGASVVQGGGGVLSEGVNIGDPFFNSFDQYVLEDVTSDIFVRSVIFPIGNTNQPVAFGYHLVNVDEF